MGDEVHVIRSSLGGAINVNADLTNRVALVSSPDLRGIAIPAAGIWCCRFGAFEHDQARRAVLPRRGRPAISATIERDRLPPEVTLRRA
jgi:hypothetical protein